MPPSGCETSSPKDASRPATSTPEASLTSTPETSTDTCSAISSPASADGRSPHDSPDGQSIANSGRARARASRSRSPASNAAPTTSGICGPTSFASSVPDGPLSGWENRLRQRLARIGSTECLLIWRASATPQGRPLSRLVPSTPRIVEIESGSAQETALWVTASARDWKDTPGMAPTRPDGRSRIDQLPRQVAMARWSTPTAQDHARGSGTVRPQDTGHPLPQQVAQAHGAIIDGSSDTTAKPGALNPQFSCWLMGFPPEWDACAPTAMPSSRRLPRK